MKTTLFLLTFFSLSSHAKFEVMNSTGYESSTDNKSSSSFNTLSNHFFIGASFDGKENFVVGQNITYEATTYKSSTTNKISTLELGPRANIYFNSDHNFFLGLAWNPYCKGTRVVSGTSEDVSGWSYLAALGVVLKMNGQFYIGGTLNYHGITITKSINGTTATTVSNAYSSIMPMINLVYRFH